MRVLMLVALLGLALGAPACAALSTGRRLSTAPSPALFNFEAYRYPTATSARAQASRYTVIVLQSSDASEIRSLRRYNPRLVVLMYQGILKSQPGNAQMCTNYGADRLHPDWFLRGAGGGVLTAPSGYAMDIGNPEYQHACVASAVARASQGGFDGIYLDGVDASSNYGFTHGENPYIAKYPNTSSWRSAMYSLLRYAGTVVHADRLRLFANIGGGRADVWRRWNGPLDGAEEESWTDGKQGLAQQVPFWRTKLRNVGWSERHGKYVLLHSWNTTRAGNAYGLASMLLVADGRTSYSTANANYEGYEAWYPEYTTAEELGAPLGRYRRLRSGAYERRFARGMVLVNPTLHRTRRFPLHGRYSGSGLDRVTHVSMKPTSGLILLAS